MKRIILAAAGISITASIAFASTGIPTVTAQQTWRVICTHHPACAKRHPWVWYENRHNRFMHWVWWCRKHQSCLAHHPHAKPKPAPQQPTGGYWETDWITYYSPCESGTVTANGTPTYYGEVAAGYQHPFGQRVYIPALGMTFVVEDRGNLVSNGIDVFEPSCSGPTGNYRVEWFN